jgi:CheY-like chemotaxis protein/Tfp pilus assembly protein PilF
MMILDRDVDNTAALVIDGNPTSRSILMSQLRELGLTQVAQATKLSDGRQRLEARRYDLVICEQHFPGTTETGQELLDDLRRANLLPYSTVFVMVTGEARYAQVAEAAESALDCYLLKPYTANSLAERLRQARHRKRVLKDIFTAIESEQFEAAAALCVHRFEARGEFWLYAARMGAELLLRIEKHDQARRLYEAIIAAKAVPWARLGVARSQLEGGQSTTARRTLETLLAADPEFADAYDVMGRVHVEKGDFQEALETYRRAASITPGSVSRLQKQGMLAFYVGEVEEAEKLLDRATLAGMSSKMYDYQTLVLLAFCRFAQKDSKGLQRCRENLEYLLSRRPESLRLQRFVQTCMVLEHMLAKRLASALDGLQQLASLRRDTTLDIEGGCNLLRLISELAEAELRLEEMSDWVECLTLRFSTSRSISELLARSASRHASFKLIAEKGHSQVLSHTEVAMAHALEGRPGLAIQSLLDLADQSMNAKFVETAKLTLKRYRDKLDSTEAEELEARIGALKDRYAISWAAPSLGQGPRAAGSMTLRVDVRGAKPKALSAVTAEEEAEAEPAEDLRTDSPAQAEAPAA